MQAAAPNAMTLRVEEIALSYGGRRVLDGVSFTLAPGERALLLGPSGSGKSSLINVICGLQTPDGGTVALGEARVSDAVRRRRMGIVFQTLRLVSALTVEANLLLAQRLQSGTQDRALVATTLDRLGIADRARARPHQLSQGEAQRAAIARALVVRPALLIADEPTSALDRANTEAVANLLIEVAEEAGAALLVATHDDRLTPWFDRRLTLDEGTLGNEEGAP